MLDVDLLGYRSRDERWGKVTTVCVLMCSMQLSLHTVQGCADYTPHIPSLTTSLKALFVLAFFHAHSFIASLLPPPPPHPSQKKQQLDLLFCALHLLLHVCQNPSLRNDFLPTGVNGKINFTHNSVSAFSDYDLSYLSFCGMGVGGATLVNTAALILSVVVTTFFSFTTNIYNCYSVGQAILVPVI